MIRSGIIILLFLGATFGYENTTGVELFTKFELGTGLEISTANGSKVDDRIIGGYYASNAQFRYIASLQGSRGNHRCGASIILARWLLTAAHCIVGQTASQYTVLVGTNSLNTGSGTRYSVERFIAHPNYNVRVQFSNDIGLIRTTANIVYTPSVQPISIYPYAIGGGQRVIIAGWGKTSSTSGVSNDLKYTNVTTLSNSQCTAAYRPITGPNQICTAGNPYTATCNGDSGGPLSYNGFQVGLTSFGPSGCPTEYPDVYTRVLNFVPWISQNIY